MIEVKGTKAQTPVSDPAAAYATKDPERLSPIPQAIAMALVGIALYLKSLFPAAARTPDTNDSPPPTEQALAPDNESLPQAARSTSPHDKTDQDSGADHSNAGAALLDTSALSLAVIRMTAIAHRADRFSVDTPAILVRTDPSSMMSKALVSNVNQAPEDVTPAAPISRSLAPPQTLQALDLLPTAEPAPRSQASAPVPAPSQPDPRDRAPVNRAPRIESAVHLQDVLGMSVLMIGLADLLRHAVDPDGDTLSIKNLSVDWGTLTPTAPGLWAYQASGDDTQKVTISYTVTDSSFDVSQTASFMAIRPMITGSADDDLLVGTPWADDIDGLAGDDNIDGRSGDDVIAGGDGDDHILGGAGHDTIFGGGGNDILLGQAGDDHLFGGDGDDRLYGGEGDDLLDGGAGDDLLSGDAGHDILFGGFGHDELYGGAGNDVLDGGEGDDLLHGDKGDDLLLDSAGSDSLFGGDGDDRVIVALNDAPDWFSGDDGFDTLDFSQTTQGVTIDLANGVTTGLETGNDTVSGFEQAIGGQGDDHFIVAQLDTVMTGGAGSNTFEFLAGEASVVPTFVTHEITDFKYGDHLRLSHYKLFKKVFDEFEDEFEEMYGEGIDEDDVHIRIRTDTVEDVRRTIIDADLDQDDLFETTIFIQGHHVLVQSEMTT